MNTQKDKNVKIFAWFTDNDNRLVYDDEIDNAGGLDNLEFDKTKDGLEREFMLHIAPHAAFENICCCEFEIEVYNIDKDGDLTDEANWDYELTYEEIQQAVFNRLHDGSKEFRYGHWADYKRYLKPSDIVIFKRVN